MKKSEKAHLIAGILERCFPETPIPLAHKDPFTLLVAVLLSAQCTDNMVNRVTPTLFALADTPEKMAALTPEAVREIIRPCGLSPSKSKNIVALSRQLIARHKGRVPRTFEALEALPGVGHKTASVVMSQAFHQDAFPVDTHIHRLAKRWKLSSGKSVKQTEADLKRLFPQKDWNRLHLRMIYFGRKFCPARGHRKEACPVCSVIDKKSI